MRNLIDRIVKVPEGLIRLRAERVRLPARRPALEELAFAKAVPSASRDGRSRMTWTSRQSRGYRTRHARMVAPVILTGLT